MEMNLVLGFAVVALTLIAVPGPDWAFILAAGTRDHVVAPAVAGLAVGYAIVTLVVLAGVGPIVARVPAALLIMTVVGAAYLMYLGISILRSRVQVTAGAVSGARSSRAVLVHGVGVSALNPKGLLIFLAILPQFARTDARWPVGAQLAALAFVFVSICVIFYATLGAVAHRVLRSRPRVTVVTTRLAGLAMILVGLMLFLEQSVELVPMLR